MPTSSNIIQLLGIKETNFQKKRYADIHLHSPMMTVTTTKTPIENKFEIIGGVDTLFKNNAGSPQVYTLIIVR